MRNDAHYVDELTAAPAIRQIAVSEIDRDLDAGGSMPARRADRLDPARRRAAAAARRVETRTVPTDRWWSPPRRRDVLVGLRHVPCIVHDVDEPSAQQMRRNVNVRHLLPLVGIGARHPRVRRRRSGTTSRPGARPGRRWRRSLVARTPPTCCRWSSRARRRIAHATAIMLETPRLRRRELSARAFVEQIVAATATERRLSGVRLTTVDRRSRLPGAGRSHLDHAGAGRRDRCADRIGR